MRFPSIIVENIILQENKRRTNLSTYTERIINRIRNIRMFGTSSIKYTDDYKCSVMIARYGFFFFFLSIYEILRHEIRINYNPSNKNKKTIK